MEGLAGMRLGRYQILQRIGSGGMGDIYLAEQVELGRQVAVKVVRESAGGDTGTDAEAHAEMNRRFAQEARAVAALEHPHILPIYDYGQQDGIHYLAMQYVPDGSLADLLAPGPQHLLDLPLPPAVAVAILSQTVEALQYAHDRGVIHRDIKPHNLLVRVLSGPRPGSLGPQGAGLAINPGSLQLHVLLADFGLARFMAELTGHTATTGTPLYSAPEQYQGRPVFATDQYALACVAYLLLASRPVFDGTVAELYHQHFSVAPAPISQLNPALPPALDGVLARALAKDPAQRYVRIADFGEALRTALRSDLPSAGARGEPARVEAPPSPLSAPPSMPAQIPQAAQPAAVPLTQPSASPASPASSAVVPTQPAASQGSSTTLPTERDAQGGWLPTITATPARVVAIGAPAQAAVATVTSREPDAPGAPIPRRPSRRQRAWRRIPLRRRVGLVGLVSLLVAVSVGSVAYAVTHQPQPVVERPITSVRMARTGLTDLSRLAQLGTNAPAAQALMSLSAIHPDQPNTGIAADHIKGLAALPPPLSALPNGPGSAKVQSKFALGQHEIGADGPMDAAVGASATYVVEAVDGAIQVFGYNGQADGPAVAAASFFGPLLHANDLLGEPRVLFDGGSQRWVVLANETAVQSGGVSNGYIDLAVSEDSDPLSLWRLDQLSTQEGPGAPCTWADDPQLGSDSAALYLTANSYTCGGAGSFRGAILWDLPKQALIGGTLGPFTRWAGLFENAQHHPVFTVTPAVESGTETTEWLVSDDAGYVVNGQTSKQAIVWALLHTDAVNSGKLPTLIGVVTYLPIAYADPPAAIQQDTARPLATGDARIAAAFFTGTHLDIAFTTAVNWRGDTATRSGVYWADILPTVQFPTSPTGRETIAAATHQAGVYGLSGEYTYAPSLAGDAAGNMALVLGVAGPDTYPSLIYTRHRASDPPNTLGAGGADALLIAGSQSYTGNHWGDYSGAALVPAGSGSGESAWVAGAYMDSYPTHWQTLVWQMQL